MMGCLWLEVSWVPGMQCQPPFHMLYIGGYLEICPPLPKLSRLLECLKEEEVWFGSVLSDALMMLEDTGFLKPGTHLCSHGDSWTRPPAPLAATGPWQSLSLAGVFFQWHVGLPAKGCAQWRRLEDELVKASWEKALMILWGWRNFFLLFKVLTWNRFKRKRTTKYNYFEAQQWNGDLKKWQRQAVFIFFRQRQYVCEELMGQRKLNFGSFLQ